MSRILIIDPHRPEFFWLPMSKALVEAMPDDTFHLMQSLPLDLHGFDLIIQIYLGGDLQKLSYSTAHIPIIGVSMGTDAMVQAYGRVDSGRIHTVVTFNPYLTNMLREDFPLSKLKTLTWPAGHYPLFFEKRSMPTNSPMILVNSALHQYSKGLDNLVQMLADVDTSFIKVESGPKIQLEVVGPVGPFQDQNQYLVNFLKWFTCKPPFSPHIRVTFRGPSDPHQTDNLIESLSPHAYITASQGEAGATTVAEGLMKGLKVIMHDNPFRTGSHDDSTPGLLMYSTSKELEKALRSAYEDPYTSEVYRDHAVEKYGMDRFVKEFSAIIKEALNVPAV